MYNAKYNEQHEAYRRNKYKPVKIEFEKKYFDDVVKKTATEMGIPVNTLIKMALKDYIERIKNDP